MTLFVCVDLRGGMAWCGRRQSRDSAIYRDIAGLCSELPLFADIRSARLFEGLLPVCADSEVPDSPYARFVEFESPMKYAQITRRLVVYCWNRHYPSDLRFEFPMEHFTLADECEFAGTSHECITRRIYVYDAN